jgi:hypothetical protein
VDYTFGFTFKRADSPRRSSHVAQLFSLGIVRIFMKYTPQLIGACLMLVLTGCQKPSDVIGKAEATIKSAALASIAAKYPDMSSSELKFSQMIIRKTPNGQEEIFVTYDLPSSAKTTTEGKKTTTTTKTVGVRVSLSGKAESVYESTSSETYNTTQ